MPQKAKHRRNKENSPRGEDPSKTNSKYECLIKGPWQREEDDLLSHLVVECGAKDWSVIAGHMSQKGSPRLGKQCRERWFNHLSPEVRKEAWTPDEDSMIANAHYQMGNKWTAISKMLDGRPANAIKNHWNSTLKRKAMQYIKPGAKLHFDDDSEDEFRGRKRFRREVRSNKRRKLADSEESDEEAELSGDEFVPTPRSRRSQTSIDEAQLTETDSESDEHSSTTEETSLEPESRLQPSVTTTAPPAPMVSSYPASYPVIPPLPLAETFGHVVPSNPMASPGAPMVVSPITPYVVPSKYQDWSLPEANPAPSTQWGDSYGSLLHASDYIPPSELPFSEIDESCLYSSVLQEPFTDFLDVCYV